MLSVSCRGVGVDCDFLGSGGIKEEELLNHLLIMQLRIMAILVNM